MWVNAPHDRPNLGSVSGHYHLVRKSGTKPVAPLGQKESPKGPPLQVSITKQGIPSTSNFEKPDEFKQTALESKYARLHGITPQKIQNWFVDEPAR